MLGVELNLVYLSDEELDALYDDPATSPQFHESAWFAQPDPRGMARHLALRFGVQ